MLKVSFSLDKILSASSIIINSDNYLKKNNMKKSISIEARDDNPNPESAVFFLIN